jgi:MEMO1 family protein
MPRETTAMSELLPPLRRVLDVFPSFDARRPGLVIRDPLGYTDSMLLVPREWVLALSCLDGNHTVLDVQEKLTRAAGMLVYGDTVREFVGVLRQKGFLESEEFHRMRDQRHREFREQPERPPAHAGAAYPADADDLRRTLNQWFDDITCAADGPPDGIVGVAAPHVSPEGGRDCYAATYRRLSAMPQLRERIFVILGTSHWGAPGRFGVTRKPFVTPLGRLQVATEMVDWLESRGGKAVAEEDYCHATEHSIEFQCIFLQHIFGADLKILPILVGPLANGVSGKRSGDPRSEEFFAALAELAARFGDRLFWTLGIDLAHVGRRYGDPFDAEADQGEMVEVATEDRERLEMICRGEHEEFREALGEHDELKWCGASTLYTFLRAMTGVRGREIRYEQWNIDPQSVVSFTSLEFFKS